MKELLNIEYWLTRIILILAGFFLFQSSVISASASTVNSEFDPNDPISEAYVQDEIESSNWVESGRSYRVNWALLKSESLEQVLKQEL